MKIIKRLTFLFLMILSFIACSQNTSKVDYFASNALGNPVTGNAGEYYKGVTYVSYQGALEDPYVAAYDHKTKTWVGPFKAGTSLMGKDKSRKIDNHGKPTLVIDKEGYIHIVFGGHGGTRDIGKNPLGNYHYGKQMHVVSKNPLDISSWEVLDNISPFGTYSQFIKMDNGDLYLFYRHGAHRSNRVYQKSTDNGRTFSAPVSYLKTKQIEGTKEHPVIYDSWYTHYSKGQNNDVIVSYNYHLCKGPKHDGERHNVYYMRFDTDKNEWYNIKGDKLTLPITKEQADNETLVYDTGDLWTHNGIVRLDEEGNPHLTSYEGEHKGLKHGAEKSIVHYYWSGNEWMRIKSSGLPVGAKGEMEVLSSDKISMLISYKEENMGEVALWESTNGGKSFIKKEILLQAEKKNFDLSNFIRNAKPEGKIIIAAKDKSGNGNVYLVGEKGVVKR